MFGKHKGRLGRRGARASLAPDVFGLPHGSPLPRPVSGVSGHAAAASSPAEGRFRARGALARAPLLRSGAPARPAGFRLPLRRAPGGGGGFCATRRASRVDEAGILGSGEARRQGPRTRDLAAAGTEGPCARRLLRRAGQRATRGTATRRRCCWGAGRGDSRGRGDTPRRRSWEKWCARASSGAGRQPPRAPPRRTLTPSSGRYLAQVWAPGAPTPGPWGAQLRGPGRPRTFPIPALRRTAPRPGEDAGGAGRAVSVAGARGGVRGRGLGGAFPCCARSAFALHFSSHVTA